MSYAGKKLALGSMLRVFNLVATALVSILMMPLVVHSLGDRMYGIWILAGAFVSYYGLLDLGLSSAVNRYFAAALGAADQEQCNRVFNAALRIFSALGLAVLVLGCIASAVSPLFCKSSEDAAVFRQIILISSLTLAISFPMKAFGGMLEANLRYDRTVSVEILNLLLRNALILVFLRMGFKIVAMAWIILLVSSCTSSINIWSAYKNLPFLRIAPEYWQRKTVRTLFSHTVFTFVANLADILRFQADAFVVAAFVGLAAVTHYRIAGALTEYYTSLMIAVTGVFASIFSRQEGRKDFDALRNTFLFATKISVCISTFVAFGLLVWGEPFITRWMGERFLDAYPCLVVLVLGCTFALWQAPSVTLLFGISKHKFLALFNCGEGVVNLLLSLLLVRRYGMLGVALGTCIPMMIVKLFIQPVYVCRVLSIDLRQYLWRTGRTLLISCGSLVIPYLLSMRFAVPNYRVLLSVGFVSLICYVIPLLICELTPTETLILQQVMWPNFATKKTT